MHFWRRDEGGGENVFGRMWRGERETVTKKKGVGDIVIEIKTPFFQLCEVHYQVDVQSQGGD